MNLLIIEDEDLLSEKYKTYLDQLYDQIVIARSYYEAKDILAKDSFDVLLIDYNLPDGNGLEIVKTITKNGDSSILVMITAYSKEKLAIESLNLGVFKYIEKPVEKEELIHVMTLAHSESSRRLNLNTLETKFSVSEIAKNKLMNDYFLSKREVEVLENILLLGKNRLVGSKLNISQGTIRNHLTNIYQKLHISDKDELREKIYKMNNSKN